MSKAHTTTRETVRTHYGEPSARATAKQLTQLDHHARAFIGLSPFLVIASSDANGRGDATPRGDAPGFVAVLDDTTLLIPDRPGNKRVDTMLNVVENPHIGLLFLVPGIHKTLRVNGRARFTADARLLKPLALHGKDAVAGLLVEAEEVYLHCGKALIRSRLWDQDTKIKRSQFPSLGRILADQIAGTDLAESERSIQEGYQTKLYQAACITPRAITATRNRRWQGCSFHQMTNKRNDTAPNLGNVRRGLPATAFAACLVEL